MNTTYLIAAITVAMAVSRLLIPGHPLSPAGAVEAFEHIGVGVLLALCFVQPTRRPAMICLAAVTLVEIGAFLVFAAR